VYNVGTGVGHSVRQVLALIEECFGSPARYEAADETLEVEGLPEWSVLDVAKARCQLGWEAEIALRDGIREMIERQRHGLKAG
jgi:nucleoside-diphosphate-sugar epimerase